MTTDLFSATRTSLDQGIGRLPSGRSWLDRLPDLVCEFQRRWSLELGIPYTGGACSWAAPATLPDGTRAVLKATWPHPKATDDAKALIWWDGRGAARSGCWMRSQSATCC